MRFIIAILIAVAALSSPAQAQSLRDLLDQLRVKWNTPTEPFRIVGNVYYIGTAGLASYLIATPKGHILIDSALPEATPQIEANVQKLGFKLTDIKQLLNSHAHFDHAGGLAELKRTTGAPLAASAADKPLLEGGYYPGQENDASMAFPAVKVDRVIGDGDTVKVDDVTLTAMLTPGHSPGCTSWKMTVTENNRTHDLFLFCSGTVAANRLVDRPTHPTIVADYKTTFARMRDVKADIFLAPHPEMFDMAAKRSAPRDGAQNPFIRDGELNAYVANLEIAFDKALAAQKDAAQKN